MKKRTSPFNVIKREIGIIAHEHLLTELIIPLGVGVLIAALFHRYLIAEILLLIIITISVFMYLSYRRVKNISINATYDLPLDLNEVIKESNEFFCTSVIPTVLTNFGAWFTAEMIESFSINIERRLSDSSYKACRVLLFENDQQLKNLRYQIFDGIYAKRVACIHGKSGVDLAFMRYERFEELCSENINKIGCSFSSKEALDKIKYDFAIFLGKRINTVLAAESIEKKTCINPIRKTTYKSLEENSMDKAEYITMMNIIKKEIYRGDLVKDKYNFYKYLIGT